MIMTYYVIYKAGKMNCNEDALSRNPVPSPTPNNGVFPLTRSDSNNKSLFDWPPKLRETIDAPGPS